MRRLAYAAILGLIVSATPALAGAGPAVIYWDTAEGKALRARIPPDADYWQLAPTFAVQITQSYCSVASAVTVLNAMPIQKPVDPDYAPYAYFTQRNFFTPDVAKIISPQTVLAIGMTREEMAATLSRHHVAATSIAGDTFDDHNLRALLQKALADDGQFVLANYLRANLGQVGGGHWSILAAYDAPSDSVLILDVAKYKYPPVWVAIGTLRQAIATIDTTSNKARGLVIVTNR
ncbi:MAG: phytochelatin synthase family protein [Nitrosomonadales bacterium]|nr:phytochelatin synthase family protein [Nitrosomonadales bacterium]